MIIIQWGKSVLNKNIVSSDAMDKKQNNKC